MKKVNAIVMQYEEFETVVNEISNGHAGIGIESGEWFYVADDEYNVEEINKDLSKQLNTIVLAVKIDTSASQDEVVIICE